MTYKEPCVHRDTLVLACTVLMCLSNIVQCIVYSTYDVHTVRCMLYVRYPGLPGIVYHVMYYEGQAKY